MTQANVKKNVSADFNFDIKMISPKIIIDEYLLAEQVQNIDKPCYFLLDMGDWEMQNSVDQSTVELEQSESYYYKDKE